MKTEDGRQSEPALRIMRGVRRLLRNQGLSSLPEVSLPNGRRADIVAMATDGSISIIEIKSSLIDFRSDKKWQSYRDHCDRLYFAVAEDFPHQLIPVDAGLIVADAFGAEIIREASETRLAPATRRKMLLTFGLAAADRLHFIWDPNPGD